MKSLGLMMLCFCGVCAYIWIYDTHDADRPIRLCAGLAGIVLAPGGWLFFFEGLKREIVDDVMKNLGKKN